jgi:uncharacterized protein (TIGR03437 family)
MGEGTHLKLHMPPSKFNEKLDRRRMLALVGAASATAVLGGANKADAATCLPTPAQTEGPYFVEENLNRSDIRSDPATGVIRPGTLLTIKMTVSLSTNSACALLPGARVEIWHCDALGTYSDVGNARNQEFLRGYQITDENGVVNFTTIYPGWYMGRAVHIHFKVRTYNGAAKLDEFTSQFFFDESLTDTVFTQTPYNTRGRRDTLNSTDGIFRGTQNNERLLAAVTRTEQGYAATIDVAVNLRTPAISRAVVTSSGVVNAASFQPGVAPGAWITIFGENLANATRAVATSDLVNNTLPTTLGGVGVKINGKDAFIQYVSPTQINVQAPADENTGNVQVMVTNAGGTSDAVTAVLQQILPAFFTTGNYVAAVRQDGTVLNGTTGATPGGIVLLYGNGFGPTTPVVAPGRVGSTAAPLASAVTITIGGMSVPTTFAGLSEAGLYQFNVTLPGLSAGDHEVIAEIAGQRTKSGVFLRVQP